MIVATAGHVDHGKTTLVRALTGVETDRLPEERKRGLSIDLGFAYADLPGGGRVGFVDVPGHERFVGNLLAGVAAIDLALLVVAADDGPMPQTREHLTILALLGVPRCIVALTKIDRVDAARRAAARGDILALLADGAFAGAPVVPVAAARGEGIAALREAIAAAAAERMPKAATGGFRLAVDRSFLIDGVGRVVTGAVLSGTVGAGDRVVVSPGGGSWRVRGVHAQGRPAEAAWAGERCALNLATGGGSAREAAPVRGDWVVAPSVHAPTDRLDARLVLAPGAALRPHGTELRLHLGGAALPARVAVLGDGFAQLATARPVAALHGDRFVLRDPAAGAVVAGGTVVDPFAVARGRTSPAHRARLAALADDEDPAVALAALVAIEPEGVDLARFAVARNAVDTVLQPAGVRVVATGDGPRAVAEAHWRTLRSQVRDALAAWHRAEPASAGPDAAAVARALGRRPAAPLLRAVLDDAADGGEVVREGFRWRLAGHRPVLPPADAALLERVTAVLAPAGLRPPIVGDLAARLALPQDEVVDFLTRAARFGALVRVAPNRWFLPQTVAELAGLARELAAEGDAGFDAATYRDRSGIGRNLTIQVLECLDRAGVTRFRGGRRIAVG